MMKWFIIFTIGLLIVIAGFFLMDFIPLGLKLTISGFIICVYATIYAYFEN